MNERGDGENIQINKDDFVNLMEKMYENVVTEIKYPKKSMPE